MFGTRVAVLAGDFMFAQSSWYLANLENLQVIKLISQVKPYHIPTLNGFNPNLLSIVRLYVLEESGKHK